jgi:peptidoglycan/xylan/chitin deacetylase (PgdA/CDA1 family)
MAKLNIINNGKTEANNIKVKLILSDYFSADGADINWDIGSIDASETKSLSTNLKVVRGITSDMVAWCTLQITSDGMESLTLPKHNMLIYGVKPFDRHYIPIIGLHAIEDKIKIPIELPTGYFDHLCSTLKKFGFETITFMDLLNYLDYGKALPEKPVIITSDDGFQDVYTNAFPILKKYGYKMTIFLVTGYIGNSDEDRKVNSFDSDQQVLMRPILIWPEIIEMYKYGCEFQSHSVNHIRLGIASDEEFLYELIQSKNDIESRLGNQVLFFAWPRDNNSPLKWPLIAEAGYRGAVRYGTGIEDLRTININDIKRVQFNSQYLPQDYADYLKIHDIVIENKFGPYLKETGEEFTLRYTIKNNSKQNIHISSLELELPSDIQLTGMDADGYINQMPGLSQGIYMWVSDLYEVKGKNEIDLGVKLKALGPGKSIIKFRITANEIYIKSDDVEIEIK